MTKKLEDLFNLPPMEDVVDTLATPQTPDISKENTQVLLAASAALDKIDDALPLVRDLEDADAELDELSTLGREKFEEIIELAMAVEPRFSAVILQTASQLLGHAITAKNAKVENKLRRIDLQIKKRRVDLMKKTSGADDSESDDVKMVDRNTLLADVLSEIKKNSQSS